MTFTPATTEQRFVLEHVAGIGELCVDADIVDAVLEGAGAFAAGEWAPLDRIGDTVGAKWTSDGARMPEGYSAAYNAYVEGGWGRSARPRHVARAGAADQPRHRGARDPGHGKHGLRAVPDPDGGRDLPTVPRS